MNYKYDDGGRAVAGFKGRASDCVVRAIAIASGLAYAQVHKEIDNMANEDYFDGSDARRKKPTRNNHS